MSEHQPILNSHRGSVIEPVLQVGENRTSSKHGQIKAGMCTIIKYIYTKLHAYKSEHMQLYTLSDTCKHADIHSMLS